MWDILEVIQLLERLLELISFTTLDLTKTEMALNHFYL